MKKRFKIFRWKAVGPLLLFLLILVVLWVIFADTIARVQAEDELSSTLGTEVDIGSLRIREADAAVDIGDLAIADPRDRMKNLFEAGTITVDVDPLPLAEKKIIIDQVKLSGLRFLTPRKTPARPADPNSPAGRLLAETRAWAREKFQFPKLALGRIDTVKSLVLNPEELGTVKAAKTFLGSVDSTRTAFEKSLGDLQIKQLVDSSTALATQLARTDPKTLGIAGVKTTITTVQKTIDRIKRTRSRLDTLQLTAKNSLGSLQQGLADVNAARLKDYAFAKGLLQLPSFASPDIGASLFGQQSTDYFQQALYYARIAEKYIPPGLQPWNRPGPKRTRMSGTTVEFPKMKEYPRFLLRQGDIDLALGAQEQNAFKATFANLTSQPALLGQPATLSASGRIAGDNPISVNIGALSRHFGNAPKDSLLAQVGGVKLPAFPFPGLPFAVNPGRSTLGLGFTLAGNRIAGSWEIASDQVSWQADSTRLKSASLVESTVWRVISGLTQLRVRAELGGTVESPTLKVSSNLDDAIAARLQGLVGEELAKAEAKARAAVDKLVDQQVAVLQTKVNELQTQALARLPVERGQLDDVQKQLEAQVKRLAGSVTGGIQLPKF
ncbi:MAG TPA: TIGR03545 family protein [Gemmatimonadales bacterium]|nr:TIGR03545 family protein [Gemmatimonadales bacterium]